MNRQKKSQQKSARRVALDILKDVREREAYANLLLPKRIQQARLTPQDAAFVTELVAGSLRLQARYDRIIELASGRKLKKIDPRVLDILRLSAHQILGMRVPVHAAVNESVVLSKTAGAVRASGFINAVSRRVGEKTLAEWTSEIGRTAETEKDSLAAATSHPAWIIDAFEEALKLEGREEELKELLEADNTPPKVSLVSLRVGKEQQTGGLETVLDGAGVFKEGISPLGYVLNEGSPSAKMDELKRHSVEMRVQDQGSQIAALALVKATEVKPDESWADLCAGPGGKTALLASQAEKYGVKVWANEISEHRAKLVRDSTVLFNENVSVVSFDGRTEKAFGGEKFDRILVDAPCSGLGALRRRPEARWRKTADDIEGLTVLQKELLQNAAKHTKTGGVVAYVTCSPHPAETREIVADFLNANPEFEELDAQRIVNDMVAEPVDLAKSDLKSVQLWPHRHGTDAMFISLLQKVR